MRDNCVNKTKLSLSIVTWIPKRRKKNLTCDTVFGFYYH